MGLGNDSLATGAGLTRAFAGPGDDRIQADPTGQLNADVGDGDDSLIGGRCHDQRSGGPGADHRSGGAGHDRVVLSRCSETEIEFLDGGDGFDVLVIAISIDKSLEREQLLSTLRK